MNKSVIRLLLVVVSAAVAGLGLYASIEFYEEDEKSGWSVAALRNPYLAAQQFLQRSDVTVTDIASLAELDQLQGVGTLFFSDANQVQSPRQLRAVLGWLEDGGNVIYSANDVDHEDDLLLAEFAVSVEWRDPGGDSDDRSLAETMREYNRQIEQGKSREEAAQVMSGDEPGLTTIRFDDEIGAVTAAFGNQRVLLHPDLDGSGEAPDYTPFSWSTSDTGVHLMQFELGGGLLTIVSDPTIWTSARIDQYDHAYLLWLLISTEGSFATLRSVVRATLWQLLRDHAEALMVVLLLLVLLTVWRSGQRFGPVIAADDSRRRSLGQHFSALSLYLWHKRDAVGLLEAPRQRAWHRAGLVLGGFATAERARQFDMIAEHMAINANAVARAFGDEQFNESSFVNTVRLLKRIEQSL